MFRIDRPKYPTDLAVPLKILIATSPGQPLIILRHIQLFQLGIWLVGFLLLSLNHFSQQRSEPHFFKAPIQSPTSSQEHDRSSDAKCPQNSCYARGNSRSSIMPNKGLRHLSGSPNPACRHSTPRVEQGCSEVFHINLNGMVGDSCTRLSGKDLFKQMLNKFKKK